MLWVKDPLHVRPIDRALWDPHFGQPEVEVFPRGGALDQRDLGFLLKE